ncbi:acyltransferase family protein [Clostridium gasigenes]|uniref:acyltransferase family protein n=1 Tax=Clostridium gasigenes TaxID=94869 RepID=UPI001C0B672C|nr:acyltransferase [Clostridium gasigenes]MBU3108592.1 acyltransferase [Clostridium gasigenes]
MEQAAKERSGMIDVLRLVFAISVVMVHTSALLSLGEGAWVVTSLGLSRIAVPFFFVVSGYFYFKNCKNTNEPKKTLKRLIKLYFKWMSIELLILFPGFIFIVKENPFQIVRMLLFVGVTGSLWYVISLFYAIAISGYFFKKDKLITLIIIGVLLYLFGVTGDAYGGFFQNTFLENVINRYKYIVGMPQAGITTSLLFVTIGALIYKYNLKDKIKKAGVLSLLGIGLLLVEAFTLYYNKISLDYNMYLSLVIVAPIIFIWALNSKLKVKENTMKLCRELSIGIYCSHQIIMLIIITLVPAIGKNTVLEFILTLIGATLLALTLRKFKYTRNLVN